MDYSKIFGLGNRIEIQVAQQVERAESTGEQVSTYISNIFDILDTGQIEIAMPTENEKLILFPVGIRLKMIVFSKGGMNGCIVKVVDRYKRDNFYLLKVEVESEIERVQRRAYYRMNCTLDFTYYELTAEQEQLSNENDIIRSLEVDENYYLQEKVGLAVDISGGGMRFRGGNKLKEGSSILIFLPLTSGGEDIEFHIVGYVISSKEFDADARLYESRIKFVFYDKKIQERIVRYIFEEERRIRKKENG